MKLAMKIGLGALLFLVIGVCLCSCVKTVELTDRAIVQAVGIDYSKEDETYKLTLQYFNQSGQSGENQIDKSQDNVLKAMGSGKTVAEAKDDAAFKNGKDLMLSENQIIILGRDACEQNLEKTLNYFAANYQSHPRVIVVVAEETAEDLLDIKFKEGIVSTEELTHLVKNSQQSGYTIYNYLYEVMTSMKKDTRSVFLPVMGIVQEKTDTTINTKQKQSGGGGEGGGDTDKPQMEDTIEVTKGAVFTDGVLKGIISLDECKGISWLTNSVNEQTISIDLEDSTIPLTCYEASISISPEIVDEKLIFCINVDTCARLMENYKIDESDIEKLTKIAEQSEQKIAENIDISIQKIVYDYGADIFFLEDSLRQKQYGFWRKNRGNVSNLIKESDYRLNIICRPYSKGLRNS